MKSIVSLFLFFALSAVMIGCGKVQKTSNDATTTDSVAEQYTLELAPVSIDFSGIYKNNEESDVTITKTDAGHYNFVIGIFRLCEMEGTATNMDAAVETILTDPNGNELNGIFFPNEDGTFTFKVTASTWNYLEVGQEVKGFTRQQ